MSVRQDIVDALSTKLQGITKANGYATDLGARVFPWRKTPITIQELPSIVFMDTIAELTADETSIGSRLHSLTIDIVAMASTKTSASQCRAMIADIFKAIGTDDTFGGKALWSMPLTHEINSETDGDILAAARVTLTVTYRTTLWGV